MRRLIVLPLVVVAAGCGASGSGETAAGEERPPPASRSAERTSTDGDPEGAPQNFAELLADVPPFDVPVSDEVDAYRRASLGAFYERCLSGKGGAREAAFVRANRSLLDRTPRFPGSTSGSEFTIDSREGNGCPEGSGPATSYTTYRNFRLPPGTRGEDVTRFYESRLRGWTKTRISGTCEQAFRRGQATFAVRACGRGLTLSARALVTREVPPPPPLPPRPSGEQYPLVDGVTPLDRAPTEYVEPGTTCERTQASSPGGVVTVILPPTPGLQAALRSNAVVVEWSLGKVHGDCPPTTLLLSVATANLRRPPYTTRKELHTKSGVTRIELPDSLPRPTIVRAAVYSVDGRSSRTVTVLIRR